LSWQELALLLALVSRWNARQANVPMRGGHYSVRAALCITIMRFIGNPDKKIRVWQEINNVMWE